jgi:hypothetical protein
MLIRVNSFGDKIENPIRFFYVQSDSVHIFPGTSVKFGSVATCLCNQLNVDILY